MIRSGRGYALILGAAFFWGVSATGAKYLFMMRFDALTVVQMRIMLSCLVLVPAFWLFGRDRLRVRAADLWKFALLGILGTAGSNFTYYFAIQETNVRTAILLQYMAPLMVLGWAAATGEEKLSGVKIAAVIVSVGGCFLAVSGTDLGVLRISSAGLVSGIGAAVCWAFTNIWLRRLLVSYSAWTCILWAFIFATLFWLIINPPWVFLSEGYGAREWGALAVIAVTSVLIPHSLYYTGMRYLTSTRAMITAAAEPVIAIATAWLFIGEPLGPWHAAGAAAVLGAIALLQTTREEDEEVRVLGGPATLPKGTGDAGHARHAGHAGDAGHD